MTGPVPSTPQIPQTPDQAATAAAAAAVKLVRASLDALMQQMGQQLTGKIVPGAPTGLTQIALADQVLTLKLSQPLPAGTQVQVQVQPGANGQPAVTVTPQPVLPQAQMPAPAAPQQSAPLLPQQSAPLPQAAPPAQPPQPQQPAPLPASPQAPVIAQPAIQAAPPPIPRPVPASPQPPPQVSTAPPSPAPTAAPATATTPAPAPPAAATSPAPTASPLPQPSAPTPQPPAQAPVAATAAPQAPVSTSIATPPQVAMPTNPAPSAPPAQVAAQPPVAAPPQQAAPSGPQPTAPPAVNSPPPAATASAPSLPQPTAPAQTLSQRVANSFTQAAQPAPPPAPGSPAQAVLTVATQAAARQQSAAPLLQALAARLPDLPPPVAQAALRVLAGRINLDRGAPPAETIKQAVLRSGVFLGPPAKLGAPPDAKTALTQLRGALLGWLGEDIAAVAPILRRPPPPARGHAPRGQTPQLPPQSEGGAKETGKSLLSQTEGALSRLRLMQMASHPTEAARPGMMTPPSEWNLELPMMLGHELTMAHLQIARDGQGKSEAKQRGWRLRFALEFSVLGEVGAQIAMLGAQTSVTLWAEEDATAMALEEMLPELAPALAAKGLEVGTIRVRRGVPDAPAKPAGRLMDAVT